MISKGALGCCLFGFVLVAGACSGGDDESAQAQPIASAGAQSPSVMYKETPVVDSSPTTRRTRTWVGPDPLYGVNPVQADVVRIIDGDTFEIAGDTKVRPLGIDSCEMNTPGGAKAKEAAEWTLGGRTVLLTSQPGVDLDPYGRQLRYVTLNGTGDFGEQMVQYDHTGVYQGKNDANPAYVAFLGKEDKSSGRDCSGPSPATPVNDDNYVPAPNNDDDNHHKSRFCRRHWYC